MDARFGDLMNGQREAQPGSASEEIIKALLEVGITSSDIILVHSDASLAMKLSGADWWGGALSLLQSCFETVLGERGTLVVPTFNYDFCRGKPYDHERTPSQVGLFSNHVRCDPRAIRSFHPIFSFAAIGARAHALCHDVSKSSLGSGSVFDRLFNARAKIVFFNVSFESCTFVHFVEQRRGVDYRYLKHFTGEVVIRGRRYVDMFDFYVRDLEGDVSPFLTSLGERLERLGLMRRVPLDEGYILQVGCVDVHREALRALDENPYILIAHPPTRKVMLVESAQGGGGSSTRSESKNRKEGGPVGA